MGAPVAVPAVTTAFGGSMAAATATAPALLSAAAVTAPLSGAMFTGSFVPTLLTNSAGIGSGGLLAGFGTAFDVFNKYSNIISAGFSGLQSIGAYQRGQYLEQQYKMQAEQMRVDQEIKRLNFLKAANDKTRNLLAANASTVASGFANGVNGLDGSVLLVTKKNEERYLRDISTLEFNETSSELFQDAQSSLLTAAGEEAVRGSKFDALVHIGNAYYIYNQTRVPGQWAS